MGHNLLHSGAWSWHGKPARWITQIRVLDSLADQRDVWFRNHTRRIQLGGAVVPSNVVSVKMQEEKPCRDFLKHVGDFLDFVTAEEKVQWCVTAMNLANHSPPG